MISTKNRNLCFLILIFCVAISSTQQLRSSLLFQFNPNSNINNNINYGLQRSSNLLNFNIDANLLYKTKLGEIGLFQKYLGSAGISDIINNRHDERFSIYYKTQIIKNLKLININNYLLSSDNIRSNDNIYQRINSNAGLDLKLFTNTNLIATIGVESNTQSALKSNGIIYGILGESIEELNSNYNLNTKINYEILSLDDNRYNRDVVSDITLIGRYNEDNSLLLNTAYNNEKRDFLSHLVSDRDDFFESRNQTNYATRLNSHTQLSKNIFSDFNLMYSKHSISRYYNEFIKGYYYTAISKNQLITNFNIDGSLKIKRDDFFSDINFKFNSRNESNNIKNRYSLDKINFDIIKNQESLLDNDVTDFSISNQSVINISYRDSLYWNAMYSINRYNTPEKNNDDKDISNFVTYVYYSRRISKYLILNILAEYRDRYLVFLKSTRSAQNNHNRVLRFAPSLDINISKFHYYPQTEVLANYTIYDHETNRTGIKSYSFRQVSYKDSIIFDISDNFKFYTDNQFRYFINGILYWETFSENPQIENIDYQNTIKFILIRNKLRYGLGMRYITQKRNNIATPEAELIYQHSSIGPTINLTKVFDSNSEISFSGWYERQNVLNKIKWIPNLQLNCMIRF